MNPPELKYSKEHEWVRVEASNVVVVGITHHAAAELGDIVYLDLPGPNTELQQFTKFGEIESVKAVSDLFSPISGQVLERNDAAVEKPEKVNEEPYGEGWLLRVSIKDPSELGNLITAQQYEEYTAKGE